MAQACSFVDASSERSAMQAEMIGRPTPEFLLRPTSAGRRARSRLAIALTVVALGVALVPLIAIGSFIVSQGIGVIRPDFFLQDPPGDLSALGGGIRNAIVGTLEMTGLASLIAVPAGLLIAIFNAEIGGKPAIAVRFAIDVLAALPSIVVGIFVYELVVVAQGHFSGFAGSVALAVIMLPVIVVSTEEMLRLTPRPVAEGCGRLESVAGDRSCQFCFRPPSQGSSQAFSLPFRGPSARPRPCSLRRSETTSSR